MWTIRGKAPYHPWNHSALLPRHGAPAGAALRLSQQPGFVTASADPTDRARGIRSTTDPTNGARGIWSTTDPADRTRGISSANPTNGARGIRASSTKHDITSSQKMVSEG